MEDGCGNSTPNHNTNINHATGRGREGRTHEVSRDPRSTNIAQRNPTEGAHTATEPKRIVKNTRAALKIASLNMKGRNTANQPNGIGKWTDVRRQMKEMRIGMMVLQETHLDENHYNRVRETYKDSLKVFNSADPTNPTGARGIAVVLNRERTNITDTKMTEIIPGRAIRITHPWHKTLELHILAIYAPNDPKENEEFWTKILSIWQSKNYKRLDLVIGDFNIVLEAVDRMPHREDNGAATDSLKRLVNTFGLVDGWRERNPIAKRYTYSDRNSHSRIDRIYATKGIYKHSGNWDVSNTIINTDHIMVTTEIINRSTPFIGKGRWTIPVGLIEDEDVCKYVQTLGKDLEDKIKNSEGNRSDEENPQTFYESFKEKIREHLRETAKTKIPETQRKIQQLEEKIIQLSNSQELETNEQIQTSLMETQIELKNLLINRNILKSKFSAAKYNLEGETISKYWSKVVQEKKPREIIYGLLDPKDPNKRERHRSDQMAEIARAFFDELQNDDPYHLTEEEQREIIQSTLEQVTPEIPPMTECPSGTGLSRREIKTALNSSENGKASGLDGIPYELWKDLVIRHEKRDDDERVFDILAVWEAVFEDINEFGLAPGSKFADGWICPIFKKKDPREITNYRPITLLNTDYKILTKSIANRIARYAPKVIHPDQAGFIKGRTIFDQVKLAKLMTEYAEATEEGGVIVALDQEKAYDRIKHDYLWETLAKYGIPAPLIKFIRNLYKDAKSIVIINGVRSKFFVVRRGVRQGDPLSCLLFDFAIEPMAERLRRSDLEGFKIPGTPERLLTKLFADDTTVYLAKSDKISTVFSKLEEWCRASGAKFNTEKTEIIPIGSTEFRNEVIKNRKLTEDGETIPADLHIAKDGEATRILGAWIGNKFKQEDHWDRVIKKVQTGIKKWGKCNPTMKGKKHIVQMIVGGMTQYQTKAQGMPTEIEKKLNGMIKDFVWDNKKPKVHWEIILADTKRGGLNILDIKTRNKAIALTDLRSFLDFSRDRPMWAFVADALISGSTVRRYRMISDDARSNIFLQGWKANTSGNSPLPNDVLRMLRTAEEMGVRLDSLKPGKEMKMNLPAWYHLGANDTVRKIHNGQLGKCLRENHCVQTVADLVKIRSRIHDPKGKKHSNRKNCACPHCREDRRSKNCKHPNKCTSQAGRIINALDQIWHPYYNPNRDDLTLTKRRKEKNLKAHAERTDVTFDPTVTERGDVQEGFRAFTKQPTTRTRPALRQKRGFQVPEEATTVHTEGHCINDHTDDAQTGAGLWYGVNDPRNKTIRLPEEFKTSQTAEIIAILVAAKNAPPFAPLHIRSSSGRTINELTKNLQENIDKGYIGVKNASLLRATVAALQKRSAITTLRWSKKRDGEEGKTEASRLADEGARKQTPDEIDLEIDGEFNLQGAKINKLTQALAYKGIREQKETLERLTTTRNISRIKSDTKSATGSTPSTEKIWESIRKKSIPRKIADFLWNAIHGTQKCGKYWENIPGYEERATCSTCGEIESMEHILTKCKAGPPKTIWNLTEKLWAKKKQTWWPQTIGTILGTPTIIAKDEKGLQAPHLTRLLHILILESAYLIWKLRCERVITDNNANSRRHSTDEITNRWLSTINNRLTLDRIMTHESFGVNKIENKLVLRTWEGLIREEEKQPPDWCRSPGVLVGNPTDD